MPSAFEKLDKILRLEQSQGHRNRAVIGGMESFVERWRHEAQSETSGGATRKEVEQMADLLAGYAEDSVEQRARTVSNLLSRLQESSEGHVSGDLALGEPGPPSEQPVPSKPEPQGTPTGDRATPASESARPVRLPALTKPTAPERPPKVQTTQPSAPLGPTSRPMPTKSPPPSKTHAAQVVAVVEPQNPPRVPNAGLDASVSTLPGIKTTFASRLEKLGITTVRDLLYHFPHRYDDYSALKPIGALEYGEDTTIIGVIWETNTRKARNGRTVVSSIVADASGTIEAVWFNQPYLTRQLRAGRRIVLSGKVDEYLGRLTLQSPAWEPLASELIHTGRLVPVYPLTKGISSRWMRSLMKRVTDHWAPRLRDHLPEQIREGAGLISLSEAIAQIHFPESPDASERARHRLSFDEFLFVQLGLLKQRQQWKARTGVSLGPNPSLVQKVLSTLPYELTDAQRRCLDQILNDVGQERPMSRLLQGDVGSGKTVVAATAMLVAVAAGKQAALMAPTEILAQQHYQTINDLLSSRAEWGLGRPVSASLLTGSLRRVERGKVYAALASGQADIVVGTHALIQKHVTFKDLALAVVDEQHRFGVVQRATLRAKGASPHVLVMSATPIPRSLALTVYGDLDISVIDELPLGREPIGTRWLLPRERERAYSFVRGQVEKGRQAFVLYPLVEESDKLEARAATEEYERLRKSVFSDLSLGLLHGRMRSAEKDRVMSQFREGTIDILVSTSVVEVGIDVPNATVMLIEGADRFGLSQLHQFRGRVGRGGHKSFCLLLSDSVSPDDPGTRATWERLRAIEETQDGFVLAEKDLELRGPGDFFGIRQSGLPPLQLASLSNVRILEQARKHAQELFKGDPSLSDPQNALLAQEVSRFWQGQGDLS